MSTLPHSRARYLFTILVLLAMLAGDSVRAQSILNKIVPLEVTRQRLDHVLEILSNRGNFYFSYNSSIIRKDSIVSISGNGRSVGQILKQLFGNSYEFIESGNYVIIRMAPLRTPIITSQTYTDDKVYVVSGYLLDESSGEGLRNATVYEKHRLQSTLTDSKGYFEIRFKSRPVTTALTFSKEFYQDTTIVIQSRYNQQLRVAIPPAEWNARMVTVSPEDYLVHDSIVIAIQVDSVITHYGHLINDSVKVERTFVGRIFVSSRQLVQSLNLKKFFTERPFQLSLLPGISTHGWLNAQVVNKVSLNMLGGYSAGVNGVELGGWFNIDKQSVRWVQMAGWFNLVGGSMTGFQAAGLHNLVLDSVTGAQFSGISNVVKKKFHGFQAAGIYNHVGDSMKGAQMAGIANFTRKSLTGFQAAGIANVSTCEVKGTQMAGIVNYTHRLKGVQIGLINIADTSEGCSIGLINIVLKGYHKLVLSANEVTNTNAAFKTGTEKFYSILQAGSQTGTSEKLYSFGYGVGWNIHLNDRWSVSPEILAQMLYMGKWDADNFMNRINVNLNFKLGRFCSVSAGPAFSAYYTDKPKVLQGYKSEPAPGYHSFTLGGSVKGWIGWNAAINLF
ncbi:MAG: carboxypeptidase-like regulatory domain-containing protein [Bacteroidetes bacterium]|nr:carboxypeptidase-like regulatory domain-containing protein [Bacteroidota bacterium]